MIELFDVSNVSYCALGTTRSLFENLFTRCYSRYSWFKGIYFVTPDIITQNRYYRFQYDEYWKIWKMYNPFVGFCEAFFHIENGDNVLPLVFKAFPEEEVHFMHPESLLDRFKTSDDLASLLYNTSKILDHKVPARKRNMIANRLLIASNRIIDEFSGIVPSSRHELLSFNGISRKLANLILNVVFDSPEVAIDIHVFRAACYYNLIPFGKNISGEYDDTIARNTFKNEDWVKVESEIILKDTLRKGLCEEYLLEADFLLWTVARNKDFSPFGS